jgi:hypothetical protein
MSSNYILTIEFSTYNSPLTVESNEKPMDFTTKISLNSVKNQSVDAEN